MSEITNKIIIDKQPAQVAVKILGIFKRPNRPLIIKTIKEGNTIFVSSVDELWDWYEVFDLHKEHLGYCRVGGVTLLPDEFINRIPAKDISEEVLESNNENLDSLEIIESEEEVTE